MKVYVTQGHEKGIGLEVFFKACLMLSTSELKSIRLLAFRDSVEETLRSLKLPFKIHDHGIEVAGVEIDVSWPTGFEFSQSLTALDLGMKLAESSGILYTLPTSKDQFQKAAGHTEYFRQVYRKPSLGMFFSSRDLKVLLLSDHIPLKDVPQLVTAQVIESRLKEAQSTLQKWNWPIKNILISGFNPHAGEGGLLGNEDQRITECINRLRTTSKFPMSGPYPADTMILEQTSKDDLLVYVYHDQGLTLFKGLQGFIGSNITLGLPYPRFSPDHGTSFSLFGKNQADYRGCLYSLREALGLLKVSYGQDSSHQGQGS